MHAGVRVRRLPVRAHTYVCARMCTRACGRAGAYVRMQVRMRVHACVRRRGCGDDTGSRGRRRMRVTLAPRKLRLQDGCQSEACLGSNSNVPAARRSATHHRAVGTMIDGSLGPPEEPDVTVFPLGCKCTETRSPPFTRTQKAGVLTQCLSVCDWLTRRDLKAVS